MPLVSCTFHVQVAEPHCFIHTRNVNKLTLVEIKHQNLVCFKKHTRVFLGEAFARVFAWSRAMEHVRGNLHVKPTCSWPMEQSSSGNPVLQQSSCVSTEMFCSPWAPCSGVSWLKDTCICSHAYEISLCFFIYLFLFHLFIIFFIYLYIFILFKVAHNLLFNSGPLNCHSPLLIQLCIYAAFFTHYHHPFVHIYFFLFALGILSEGLMPVWCPSKTNNTNQPTNQPWDAPLIRSVRRTNGCQTPEARKSHETGWTPTWNHETCLNWDYLCIGVCYPNFNKSVKNGKWYLFSVGKHTGTDAQSRQSSPMKTDRGKTGEEKSFIQY